MSLVPHAQITSYLDQLYAVNLELNLTRVPREEAMTRHIEDSLTLLPYLDQTSGDVIDVGTGAGLPGMPLAIHRPDRKFVLADSSLKRVKFLQAVVETLGLANVTCVHARAEDLGRDGLMREHFEVAVARAVAPLEILVEMLLPLVHKDGVVLAMKSKDIQTEIEAAKKITAELCSGDFKIEQLESVSAGTERAIVMIHKLGGTPQRFPRASLAKRWAKLKAD